jgi:hypothetical protein
MTTDAFPDRPPRYVALCNTSADDLRTSLHHETDFETVKKAIAHELAHGNRKTVIKLLRAAIRRLEAELK